ncbi:MAG: hypothetical protein VKK05_08280, partial [Synechococcus sp.]|nr:hypothetical protein [Synechococcus sp.]
AAWESAVLSVLNNPAYASCKLVVIARQAVLTFSCLSGTDTYSMAMMNTPFGTRMTKKDVIRYLKTQDIVSIGLSDNFCPVWHGLV